jgi:hypothetical protein
MLFGNKLLLFDLGYYFNKVNVVNSAALRYMFADPKDLLNVWLV